MGKGNFDKREQLEKQHEKLLDTVKIRSKSEKQRLYVFSLIFISIVFGFSFIFYSIFLFVPFAFLIPYLLRKNALLYHSPAELIGQPDMPWLLSVGKDEFDLPIAFKDSEWAQHTIVPGTTGSGKTTFIISFIDKQASRGGGCIMVDGKSEIPTWMDFYSTVYKYNREDEIFLLSFRATANARSSRWNFMLEGSSSQISDMLINLSVGDTGSAGDNKVFMERAKTLVKIAASALTYLRDVKKEIITVNDLVAVMHLSGLRAVSAPTIDSIPGDCKQYAKYWIPNDYIEKGFSRPVKDTIIDYFQSIGANKVSKTRPLMASDLETEEGANIIKQHSFAEMQFTEALNEMANVYGRIFKSAYSDVYLGDIIANNNFLYVFVPSLEKGQESKSAIGKMVVTALRNACANMLGDESEGLTDIMEADKKRRRARPVFLIILDEYGSYVTPDFSDIFAQARSLGIAIIVAVQEYASLEMKNDQIEKKRLTSNTNIKLILKIESSETIKEIKEAVGKREILLENRKSFSNINPLDTIGYTHRDMERGEVDIIKEKDLRGLHDGYGYVLYSDKMPRKFRSDYVKPKRISEIQLPKMVPKNLIWNNIYRTYSIEKKDIDILNMSASLEAKDKQKNVERKKTTFF